MMYIFMHPSLWQGYGQRSNLPCKRNSVRNKKVFINSYISADQIAHSVEKQTRFHMEGDIANRKTVGRVPHDLGNPGKY